MPPICVQLMDGGKDIDPEAIAHEVKVDLCAECTELARRMVVDYETSPLPECAAAAARWESAGKLAALAGEEDLDLGHDDLTERWLTTAVPTVKAHRDGTTDGPAASTIIGAYTIVLSLQQLGVVETDLIGGDGP